MSRRIFAACSLTLLLTAAGRAEDKPVAAKLVALNHTTTHKVYIGGALRTFTFRGDFTDEAGKGTLTAAVEPAKGADAAKPVEIEFAVARVDRPKFVRQTDIPFPNEIDGVLYRVNTKQGIEGLFRTTFYVVVSGHGPDKVIIHTAVGRCGNDWEMHPLRALPPAVPVKD